MVERKAPAKKAAPRAKKTPEPPAEPEPTSAPVDQGSDHPGFIGALPDPTPNEDYTLSGVIRNLNP